MMERRELTLKDINKGDICVDVLGAEVRRGQIVKIKGPDVTYSWNSASCTTDFSRIYVEKRMNGELSLLVGRDYRGVLPE